MAYRHSYYYVRGKGQYLGGKGGTLIPHSTVDAAIKEFDKSDKIYKDTLADSKRIGSMLAKYLNDEIGVYDGVPTAGFNVARFKPRSHNPVEQGKWIPAHAVRFNKDGSVSLLGE